MLDSLYIRNFKSFGDEMGLINLKPITLLFGANSAGKSSFLKALLLLKNAFLTGSFDTKQTVVAGESIDLGGIANMIHRKDTDRDIHIGIGFKSFSLNTFSNSIDADIYKDASVEFTIGIDDSDEHTITKDTRGLKGIKVYESGSLLIAMRGTGQIYSETPSPPGDTRVLFPIEINSEHPIFKDIYKDFHQDLSEALSNLNVNDYSIPFERAEDILNILKYQAIFSQESLLRGYSAQDFAWFPVWDSWGVRRMSLRERCRQILALNMESFFIQYKNEINEFRAIGTIVDSEGNDIPGYYDLSFLDHGEDFGDSFGDNIWLFDEFDSIPIVKKEFARMAPVLDLMESFIAKQYSLLENLFIEIDTELSSTVYMGPLRRIPAKLVRQQGGMYDEESKAWDMLENNEAVRKQVNYWLSDKFGMKYHVEIRKYFSGRSLEKYVTAKQNQAVFRATTLLSGAFFRYLGELGVDADLRKRLGHKLEEQAYASEKAKARSDSLEFELFPELIRRYPSLFTSIYQGDDPEGSARYIVHKTEGPVSGGRDAWLDLQSQQYKFESDVEPDARDISLHDLSEGIDLGLKDVGVGISQLLPIIVASVGNEKTTIITEQPELHVHPGLQAEIGDLFIDGMNRYSNSYLIETHSEHLILRMLRRIRETTRGDDEDENLRLTLSDIAVVYISPSQEGARVINIEITPDGDFKGHWPRGFFADRSKELF